MIKLQDILKEIGEATAKSYKWEEIDDHTARFYTDSGVQYDVHYVKQRLTKDDNIDPWTEGVALNVDFIASFPYKKDNGETAYRQGTYNTTVNRGEVYKLMATVTKIVAFMANRYKVPYILYAPSQKDSEDGTTKSQRDDLYKAFIKKYIPKAEFKEFISRINEKFTLVKIK